MATEIFKIQRPIQSTAPGKPWLFYDKHRRNQFEIPDADVSGLVKAAMGEEYKIFALIQFVATRKGIAVTSFQKVDDQEW